MPIAMPHQFSLFAKVRLITDPDGESVYTVVDRFIWEDTAGTQYIGYRIQTVEEGSKCINFINFDIFEPSIKAATL